MAKEPKISCEDVNIRLNGVHSGSGTTGSYYFWEETIASGSLWDICSGSSTYLRNLLGDSVMDNTDANTVRQVKEAELLYTCFKTLVQLSGGVIVSGFDWSAGVKVSQGAMLPAYRNLIGEFKLAAQNAVSVLQDTHYMVEWDTPSWKTTSPSVM